MTSSFEPARRSEVRRAGRRVVAETALYAGRLLADEGRTRLALQHAALHARLNPGLESTGNALALGARALSGQAHRAIGRGTHISSRE